MPPEHILIVDDSVPIAYSFQRYFEYRGYRVTVAYDGLTALEISRNDPINGLITDLRMPGMNGTALLAGIRERQPDVPAIILSAYIYEIGGLDDDKTRVVSKPVDPTLLVKWMRDMLSQARTNSGQGSH